MRPTRPSGTPPAWLLAASTAAVLALCAPSFAPGSQVMGAFDSDSAIPVLMANTTRHTGDEAFYWGQDRFGAWPFLLLSLLARAGVVITPLRLFAFQVLALAVLVHALATLAGRSAPLVSGGLLALALADTGAMRCLWGLQQPYVWQLCAFALAWHGVRASLKRPTRGRLLALAVLAWLGIWSSPLSMVLLGLVLGVELWLHRGPRFPLGLRVAVALGLGALADAGVHRLHQRSAARQGLWFQTTSIKLDAANLGANVSRVASLLTHTTSGVLILVALLLAAVALLRRRGDPEPLGLGIGAAAGAAATVALVTATSWMRLNAYDPRYLTPAFVLGAVAVPALLVHLLPAVSRAAWPCGLLLAALGVWRAPPALPAPEQAGRQAAADALAVRAPLVLLGHYWELYALAGLRPDAAITPVNIDGEFDRMAFNRKALRAAPEVVVALGGTERFGPARTPVPFIVEDQVLLELEPGSGFEAGGHPFARYRSRTAQLLEVTMAAAARAAVDRRNDTLWTAKPLSHAGGSIDAAVHAPEHARVVLVLGEIGARPPLPSLQVTPLDAAGARCGHTAALVGSVNVLVGELAGCSEIHGLRIQALQDGPPPQVRELAVIGP